MRHVGRTIIVLVLMGWASTSPAATWGLGANLGLSVLSVGTQHDWATSLSWPGDALFAHQPGLRVSVAGEDRAHQFYLDTGLMYVSQQSFSIHTLLLSANYQYNFSRTSSPTTFVTFGGGLVHEGTDVDTSTLPSLGAGLGAQFRVAGGHGTIRSEFRFDHFGSDESHGVEAVNAVGLKVGFDLWMNE